MVFLRATALLFGAIYSFCAVVSCLGPSFTSSRSAYFLTSLLFMIVIFLTISLLTALKELYFFF